MKRFHKEHFWLCMTWTSSNFKKMLFFGQINLYKASCLIEILSTVLQHSVFLRETRFFSLLLYHNTCHSLLPTFPGGTGSQIREAFSLPELKQNACSVEITKGSIFILWDLSHISRLVVVCPLGSWYCHKALIKIHSHWLLRMSSKVQSSLFSVNVKRKWKTPSEVIGVEPNLCMPNPSWRS